MGQERSIAGFQPGATMFRSRRPLGAKMPGAKDSVAVCCCHQALLVNQMHLEASGWQQDAEAGDAWICSMQAYGLSKRGLEILMKEE